MTKTRVYIAGPMTGYPRWNFDAFEDAAHELRALGFAVTSPHEMDLANGFDPDGKGSGFDLAAALEADLDAVEASDLVATLDNFEDSPGAVLETLLAAACGIPCVPLAEALRVKSRRLA